MKRKLFNRPGWLSLLSAAVLVLFIVLATGSVLKDLGLFEQIKEISVTYDPEKDEYNMHVILSERVYENFLYGQDPQTGLPNGPALITTGHIDLISGDTVYYTENTMLINGQRYGRSTIIGPSGIVEYYYIGGEVFDVDLDITKASGFQVLSGRYPWYLSSISSFGFENNYIQAFMDTLENVLSDMEFAIEDFDEYYENAMENLSITPYDSIIQANQAIAELEGYFRMKVDELRYAVIDHLRSDGKSTWDMVSTTYPGYLQLFTDAGVSGQEFEEFCRVLDSTLTSYGSLDKEDPFFTDSVDIRLFSALFEIYDDGSEKKAASLSTPPSEVAIAAMLLVYFKFLKGDILKYAVEQAYWAHNGIDTLATACTSFSETHAATDFTILGYILRDGGAEVTNRGIAWGTHYNPTIDDHMEVSGSGTGSFEVTISDLTEGETYYARSYAINSIGTAYGNCIQFTAASTIGMEERETGNHNFKIYPNPASNFATVAFHTEAAERLKLSIIDQGGKVVKQTDLEISSLGENRIELDLSTLQDGVYHLILCGDKTIQATRQLIIAR